jgi:hypothetical protein
MDLKSLVFTVVIFAVNIILFYAALAKLSLD